MHHFTFLKEIKNNNNNNKVLIMGSYLIWDQFSPIQTSCIHLFSQTTTATTTKTLHFCSTLCSFEALN